MSQLSQEQAREVIASIREKNGGISAKDRQTLVGQMPHVLKALTEVRKQLANSTKMYCIRLRRDCD